MRDDGTVVGVNDSNVLRARIQDIARNCDPPVRALVEPVDGVLVVIVRESDNKPVQCSDCFFGVRARPHRSLAATKSATSSAQRE